MRPAHDSHGARSGWKHSRTEPSLTTSDSRSRSTSPSCERDSFSAWPRLRRCSQDVCGRAGRSCACSTRHWLRSNEFGGAGFRVWLPQALARSADAFNRLGHTSSLAPSDRRSALSAAGSLSAASRSLSRAGARTPVTLGLGEPFSTSITVALAFALLLGLPFLLAQAWAFVAPAIAPAERRAVRPLLIVAPAFFGAGAAFGYFVVLTPAVRFLQGFNHGAFDVLVQARAYYRFELMTMLALGAIFEIPVLLRPSVVRASSAPPPCAATAPRHHWAVDPRGPPPGTDPVSALLEPLNSSPSTRPPSSLLRFSERRRGRAQSVSG